MKTLLIMRHAKSSSTQGDLPDHERPLNKRGQQDAPHMGALLKDHDLVPDLIVCSTAVRARATAEAVAAASGYAGAIAASEDLYGAGPEVYYRLLSALPGDPDRVLAVGHNPDSEALLTMLTGEERSMPTAAVAHVSLPIKQWSGLNTAVEGRLEALWRPRESG